jgi:hypothetical protein
MAVTGKLEITIKINQLPEPTPGKNGWQAFEVDCDGQIIAVTVRPKVWKKLEDAQANYPQWVASITGKMGNRVKQGFILEEPAIQVFERKAKEPKPDSGDESAV